MDILRFLVVLLRLVVDFLIEFSSLLLLDDADNPSSDDFDDVK